jgi:hypothetical protein
MPGQVDQKRSRSTNTSQDDASVLRMRSAYSSTREGIFGAQRSNAAVLRVTSRCESNAQD